MLRQEVQLEIFDQAWGEWIILVDGDEIKQERPRVRTVLPPTAPTKVDQLIEFEYNATASDTILLRYVQLHTTAEFSH